MLNWLAKIVRRVRARTPVSAATGRSAPRNVAPAPSPASVTRPAVRQIDFALLVADSGNLDREVHIDIPQDLVHECQGTVQEWISGVTLVVFEREQEDDPFSPRLTFVEKLEAHGLPGVRCLHGTSLARFDTRRGVTLKNFHTLMQHAAALRPGMFVEAGSYRAKKA